MPIIARIKQAVNAFKSNEDNYRDSYSDIGPSNYGGSTPHLPRLRYYSERSIISSIYTRISIDVAAILVRHIKLDNTNRYLEDMVSTLNQCFTLEPNIDQGPRAFRQDIVMTLFDKGVAAIVAVDTEVHSEEEFDFDILTMRVGDITSWFPKHVRINLYNETRGIREEITLPKRNVAIVENPLYAVMNETNSTLQRLIRKLSLLDAVDEVSSSGKLDLIIQLPYVIKSEARRDQAEKRRKDIEFQLKGSQYGIAYTDGTEKVTQLNRPAENNLLKQVEYLTVMLYDQLGITDEVMKGTANEAAMINYYIRTIEPILDSIIEAYQRAFIGPDKTEKRERIKYFRDPFKLVPVAQLAEIADKFTRNEITSSNEIRGFMGMAPSQDPKADQLINSNMPQPASVAPTPPGPSFEDMDSIINQVFDGLKSDIDGLVKGKAALNGQK